VFSISVKQFCEGDRVGLSPLFFGLALFILVTLLGACGDRPRLEDYAQTVVTTDGVSLPAHLYRPALAQPPGLILVHRQGGGAPHWEPLAVRAQQSGYLVLALNLRGHDPQGQTMDFKRFTAVDWEKCLLDIDAGKKSLLDAGADPENLFIAGEGLGASLALQFAVGDPQIQGLVMISPGLEYQGIDAEPLLLQLSHRPTLLVWAESDAYAAASGGTLKRVAPGHVEVHTYPGTAHGTDLFATSPQSTGQIVVWLDQMRSTSEATPNAGDFT
jgi:dienelactone hydrolase